MTVINILHIDIEGGYGGSSRSLSLVANNLDKKKINSEVWVAKEGPALERNHKYNLKCKINKNIGYIIPLRKNNIKNIVVSIPKIIRLISLAFNIKYQSKNIDLLHLNHEGLLPLACFLRIIKINFPIIVHKRSMFPVNFYTRQFSRLYKFVNGIIFITENEKKNFQNYNLNSNLNLTNQIIHNASPAILIKKNISKETNVFKAVFLGNYNTKDPDRIIELAETTKRKNLPIQYFIYGKENRKPLIKGKNILNSNILRNAILKYNLQDSVFLMGHTENPEKILLNANILIRPSRRNDPWGRDIIEGLSAGLLVIATGNNQVFIKNKINGLIFKVWNKKNISNALQYYLSNKKELNSLKRNAKKFAKIEFDPRMQGKKTTKYFESFF